MGRSRCLVILAGTLLAGLCLPAGALAGTYSWDQPANFTTTGPGSNPDHDSYGATPWSYLESSPGLSMPPPSSFTRLRTFGAPSCSPASWCDPGPVSTPQVGVSGPHLLMTAPSNQPVAVGWTSPFPSPRAVSLSDAVATSTCATTEFEDASGNGLSGTVAVPAGGTIYFVSRPPPVSLGCTSAVTIHIASVATSGPAVSLQSPANGAQISGAQPRLTGTASTAFGSSPAVTVRVYPGSSASGTPLQTLQVSRSSTGAFSLGPQPALADGQYTALAEQDDLSAPADVGLSNQTTFVVHNAPTQVNGPVKIGPRVSISKSGVVSVPVMCLANSSEVCAGDVLVLTQRSYRPRPGGPSGRLRIMFAYVSIPSGQSELVKRPMARDIAAFLRRRKFVALRFGTALMAAR